MRARDQHHTRADGDEPENRTELQPNGDRTDDTRKQRSAEGLHEQVAAHPGQPPTEAGARAGAERALRLPVRHVPQELHLPLLHPSHSL